MPDITIKKNTKYFIKAIKRKTKKLIEENFIGAGFFLERELKKELSGQRTGRQYIVKIGNTHIKYTASAPSERPAVMTGRLRASVSTNWSGSTMEKGRVGNGASTNDGVGRPAKQRSRFKVVVGTNVEYGKYLEYKPISRGGRPWMRFTVNKFRKQLRYLVTRGKL